MNAESGRVHDSARRGAEERLKRAVNDLLIEPSVQSQRLSEELKNNRTVHGFVDKYGKKGEIDSSKLRHIIRLNLNLEPLWVITGAMPQLSLAEFAPPNMKIPLTMTLNQLEILFKILPAESQTLHYLRRRSTLEPKIEYLGDELEWIGLYLKNPLLIDVSKVDGKIVKVLGNSDEIRKFLMDEFKQRSSNKPLLRLNRWWKGLLAFAEKKRMENWTEIAGCLLNVPVAQQSQFEKEFQKLRWQAYQDKSKHNIKTYIQSGGESPDVKYSLGGLCYYRLSKADVERELLDLGNVIMKQVNSDQAS